MITDFSEFTKIVYDHREKFGNTCITFQDVIKPDYWFARFYVDNVKGGIEVTIGFNSFTKEITYAFDGRYVEAVPPWYINNTPSDIETAFHWMTSLIEEIRKNV